MRLVAYLRVSTDKQVEQGNGLDVQKGALSKWARAENHRIIAWLSDEGVCGADELEAREALPEALGMISSKQAEGIAFWKLDRLARDLIVQETILLEIGRIGGQSFSTVSSESALLGDDPNDPSRTMIRQILGAVSQYERAMIVLRMKMGRATKHSKGGYAYGAPPFGHHAVDRELQPLAREQETLTRIRDLRDGGMSHRQIAEALNEESRPPKRGSCWYAMTVSRALARALD